MLCIDTETGGLNPETDALLSVGLVDWRDGRADRTLEILIDAEGLICNPVALAVNGIDLDVHHGISVPRKEAAGLIREFVRPMMRPVTLGHNVGFDVNFLRHLMADWGKVVSHRQLDTMHVLMFLGHAGVLPEGLGKLDAALAHYGIEVEQGKRHTALADALATAQLYERLITEITR